MVIFFLINLAAQNLAMQAVATATKNSPAILALAWFKLGSLYVYPPFKFLSLYMDFGSEMQKLFEKGFLVSYVGFAFSGLIPALLKYSINRKKLTSAGSAAWATESDLKSKKLLVKPGFQGNAVIVGCWDSGISYEARYNFCIALVRIFTSNKERAQEMAFKLLPLTNFLGNRHYIIDDEPSHLLMGAPSRSGKGIGVVIPTLLTWTGSSVVADPKRENLEAAGAYRKHIMQHNVLEFAPADRRPTHRFNPVNEIRWGTAYENHDVENIVGILVGEGSGNDKHWIENAKSLIIGVLTHLKYIHARRNAIFGAQPGGSDYLETSMYHVYEFLTINGNPTAIERNLNIAANNELEEFSPHFCEDTQLYVIAASSDLPMIKITVDEEFAANIHYFTESAAQTPWAHPVVVAKFSAFASKAENEASGIVSTAITALQIFSEKIVIENTCTSDFYLSDIMQSKNPTDLFLVVPPSALARAGHLFRLIIELLVIRNTETLGQNKHRCLLLIDEFPAFGKMDQLIRELGYIAGYGFKALLVFQGLEQIKNIYKNSLEMLVNTTTQIFFAPNDQATRDYLSQLLGKQTIMLKQISKGGGILAKRNYTYIEKERLLLTPDETSAKLENNSAMVLKGLRILSPKNKFFIMPDMMERINKHKKLDAGKIGLREI